MKIFTLVTFFFLTVGLFAQAYEGPYPEITQGYGAFGNHPITEKKFDNSFLLTNGYNHGDGGVEITIRYPSDVQGPMPTVLFASGWNQYDPATFSKLIDFIASKGYVVVFTPYPKNSSWAITTYEGMKQAIDENTGVNAGDLNIIDTKKIGFFGHSLGAGNIFWLGKKFYKDLNYGEDAKFLFSVAGWIGFNLTEQDLTDFPSDCKLRVEIWEEDDYNPNNNPTGGTSPRIQYYLFNKINIPSTEKNYVRVLGGPDQPYQGGTYHYGTDHHLVTMDEYNALDFYAIFRPLDAMMDYTFNGISAAKDLALGFDKDMGPFPDLDTDYDTFVFAHAENTYEYPCAVDANPFKDQCPAAPLPIEKLTPFTAKVVDQEVVLSWATASELNNEGFNIQRSQDGIFWKTIAWVQGNGTTHQSIHYRAVDKTAPVGLNYYRFEQLDFDDRAYYSNVVSVEVVGKGHVQLTPNPAHDQVVLLKDPNIQIERISILTLAGKTILQEENPTYFLNISELPKGIYTVLIQLKNGLEQKRLLVE